MHARIAGAIRRARGKRSAQWLADRTADLGYPITRAQIANYESGRKQSLDIAELIVLAVALDTSPVTLVYPGPYDDQTIEALPGVEASKFVAAEWFSAARWFGMAQKPGDDPVGRWHANTETLNQRRHLDELIATRDEMDNPEHIAVLNRQIKSVCEQLGIKIPTDDEVQIVIEDDSTDA